jgi:hypothetical protein
MLFFLPDIFKGLSVSFIADELPVLGIPLGEFAIYSRIRELRAIFNDTDATVSWFTVYSHELYSLRTWRG